MSSTPPLVINQPRCPHCGIAHPCLTLTVGNFALATHAQSRTPKIWAIHHCTACGGAVLSEWTDHAREIRRVFPERSILDSDIPDHPRTLLTQASNSLHAPAGCRMLCAAAVDSMLKCRGLIDGSLFLRIQEAHAKNLITEDMKDWANEIRLDANDDRHADVNAELPNKEDAERALTFALMLAEVLFVLPAKVRRQRLTQATTVA